MSCRRRGNGQYPEPPAHRKIFGPVAPSMQRAGSPCSCRACETSPNDNGRALLPRSASTNSTPGRQIDRQITWIPALQNFIHVECRMTPIFMEVDSVANEVPSSTNCRTLVRADLQRLSRDGGITVAIHELSSLTKLFRRANSILTFSESSRDACINASRLFFVN